MNTFIGVMLTGNTVPVGGEEAWENIYSEYIGLRENKSSTYILGMIKEISYLNTKCFIISKCVEVLAVEYSRELVMEVKQCGCRGKFDWSKPVEYSNDIRAAISYSKKFIVAVKRKEQELEDYYKRHGGGAIQRKDFDIWAVTLSKFMGFHVNYDIVTVSDWCHMMNSYERYCEVANAQQNNMLENGGR